MKSNDLSITQFGAMLRQAKVYLGQLHRYIAEMRWDETKAVLHLLDNIWEMEEPERYISPDEVAWCDFNIVRPFEFALGLFDQQPTVADTDEGRAALQARLLGAWERSSNAMAMLLEEIEHLKSAQALNALRWGHRFQGFAAGDALEQETEEVK